MKDSIIKVENKESTACCSSNQPCLFAHSVIAHARVEKVLCQISLTESTTETSTMLLKNHFELPQPQSTTEEIKVRKTYPQVWTSYNKAQTTEKFKFQELLFELCTQIEDFPRKDGAGRNRIPLSDMIFSIVFKIYSGVSGRRFISDLQDAKNKGFITKTPHFNSLFNYLELDEMFYILKALIKESASPLKTVEQDFAVDSSGFSKGTRTS